MIRFYSPVFILQLFCLYHAYSRNAEQKWYWIIMILPFFGSIFYLYKTFYSRENVDNLSEGVKHAFVSNYQLNKLEKQLKFSDTVANKMQVADEYLALGMYEQAQAIYKSCLAGLYKDDVGLLMKLVKASYLNEDYKDAITYGNQIIEDKLFSQSEARIDYTWSLFHNGQIDLAEQNFEAMDIRFSNYEHRLEYAHFLNRRNREEEARQKLDELLDEIDAMDRYERRLKRKIRNQIVDYYRRVGNLR